MSAFRHTPGKWVAAQKLGSLYFQVRVEGTPACIAEVYNHDPGADKNARLIAAAPELLAACEALVAAAEREPAIGRALRSRLADAKAALVAARGDQ